MQYRYRFLAVAGVVMTVAVVLMVTLGLKPAIDFTGGAVIEVQSAQLREQEYRAEIESAFLNQGLELTTAQSTEEDRILLKSKPVSREQWELVKESLKEKYDDLEEISFETVGPVLGQEILTKTMMGVVIAIVLLMIYIGWRFKDFKYGVTAIVALFHDLLVVVGSFALFGYLWGVEVDVMFVTATLTALAFSVHDTIVVYDRVREMLRRNPQDDFKDVVNLAINSTLVRSLSTSLSIVFVLVALALLGGQSVFWFVIALLIGTVSGTYSSPFLAVPLLSVWVEWRSDRSAHRVKLDSGRAKLD